MNATIIAAIITASGSLLIWWLTNRSKVAPPIQPSPANTVEEPKRRTTDLSHRQISDSIEAVPPLQRDAILASFIGVYVTWRGKLNNATRNNNKVLVQLIEGDLYIRDTLVPEHIMGCWSSPADCDALLIAPKGTDVIVTGKIARLDSRDSTLEDCKYEIPKKAA